MIRRFIPISRFILGICLVTSGCTSTKSVCPHKTLGLEYRLQEIEHPRPNRAHILRVDLKSDKIQPAVVIAVDPDGDGAAEAALTDPLELVEDQSTLAFINTNPWDSFPDATGQRNRHWFAGQPVDIHGLAVSGGQVRSPDKPSRASLLFGSQGRLFLGDGPVDGSIMEAMTGFQQIVTEGAVIVPTGGKRHPRTAIGVDRTGSVMYLVVVDGRQEGYSEGMNLHELGSVVRDLGCWNATNMDGGGSSIMGLADAAGTLQIVNSPSDRHLGVVKIRPLPMILTIRRTNEATTRQ